MPDFSLGGLHLILPHRLAGYREASPTCGASTHEASFCAIHTSLINYDSHGSKYIESTHSNPLQNLQARKNVPGRAKLTRLA